MIVETIQSKGAGFVHRIIALSVLALVGCASPSGQPTGTKSDLSGTSAGSKCNILAAKTETRLTTSEINVLRQQIGKCWTPPIPSSGSYPKGLVIDLRIEVNRDHTVKKLCIVDSARLDTDRVFRAVAESAKKVFSHSHCKRLSLPSEKYDAWKVLTLHFDPTPLYPR